MPNRTNTLYLDKDNFYTLSLSNTNTMSISLSYNHLFTMTMVSLFKTKILGTYDPQTLNALASYPLYTM